MMEVKTYTLVNVLINKWNISEYYVVECLSDKCLQYYLLLRVWSLSGSALFPVELNYLQLTF